MSTGQLTPEQEQIESELQSHTVCYRLHVKMPGIRRKADKEQVNLGDADAEMMGVTKALLDSNEFRAIRKHVRYMKSYLASIALPSPVLGHGVYQVPIRMVETMVGEIEKMEETFRALVDDFLDAYEGEKEGESLVSQAKRRLGGQFNEDDYPPRDKLRKQFAVMTAFIDTAVPSQLRTVSAEIFQHEKLRSQQRWLAVEEESKQLLRTEMLRLVEHMVEALGFTDNGRRRAFHGSGVEKLRVFLERAPFRNVLNDEELDRVVKDASRILSGLDIEAVRKDDGYRDALRESFETIQQNIADLVIDADAAGRRVIDLE